jgi:hypothetical protein
MASGTKGQGTTLTMDGTTIGELTNIQCPETTQGVNDITTLADTTKTLLASGVIEYGDVVVSGNYYSANTGQAALRAAVNGASHAFIITLQDTGNETCAFSAFVTKLGGPEAEKGGHLKFQATLAITGAVTWTA